MNQAFHYFLSWYQGAIWSNILASIIWSLAVGVPAFFWGRKKARKHIAHFHQRLDDHEYHIKRVHAHLGIEEE